MQLAQTAIQGRSGKQMVLLIMPPVLLLVMYLAYQGFVAWHIAPQSIHGNPMPGGMASYLLSALVIGLSYGWVAWRTGSIRWTVVSHVTMNFLGMGATLYFAS